MAQWVDWSKTTRSKDYRGSGSFATFMIIGPVCFFLGILFAIFPYDFPLLWTKEPVRPEFLDQLEAHLAFLHQSPPLIARLLNIIVFVGFLGFFIKLFKPSEANVLFDGSSLALYLVGVGVYSANIAKGFRTASAGVWHDPDFPGNKPVAEQQAAQGVPEGYGNGQVFLGREDSLKVLSASNTILALVLIGILVLQAGEWYAERKEQDDFEAFERENSGKEKTGDKKTSKKTQ